MPPTLGFMVVFVGLVLGVFAMSRVLSANPDTAVPLWYGRPDVIPVGGLILRGLAVGLTLFGATLAWYVIGFWAILLVVPVLVIPVAMNAAHNRRVVDAPER